MVIFSRQHLPTEWQKLMISDDSPIIDLYPADFRIDLNGKKYAWQGVALLPFVDEKRLLKTLESVYSTLTDEEKMRNQRGPNRIFIGRNHPSFAFFEQVSTAENDNGPVEMVDVDPSLLNGVSGKIGADPTAIPPGKPFPSPVNHEECQDLPVREFSDFSFELFFLKIWNFGNRKISKFFSEFFFKNFCWTFWKLKSKNRDLRKKFWNWKIAWFVEIISILKYLI